MQNAYSKERIGRIGRDGSGWVGEQREYGDEKGDGRRELAILVHAGDVVERGQLLGALREDDDQAEEELYARRGGKACTYERRRPVL